MTLADVLQLSERLCGLYGPERFPGLTADMAFVWLEELQRLEAHILTVAVSQWARKNTFRMPGIDDLVTLALEIDDAQQLEHSRQRALSRVSFSSGQGDYGAILNTAAQSGPYDARRWAKCHVEMLQKITHSPERQHPPIPWISMTPEQQSSWLTHLRKESQTRAQQRHQDAAALCETYAQQYPDDRVAWRQEAAWWRGGTVRKLSQIMYDRDPGEEG